MAGSPHDELKALVDGSQRDEHGCRRYLKHATGLLVDQTSHEVIHETSEYRGHSGNSDYVIVCRVKDTAGGTETVKAYIWEVKAPQCPMFEFDTKNRVCPSPDFVSAENQLLHYYDESKHSGQFRSEFGVVHSDHVGLGGIIIGCARTRVAGSNYDARTLQTLFTRALDLRRKYLYGSWGIRVLSWDTVVEYMKTQTPVTQRPAVLSAPISIQAGSAALQGGGAVVQTSGGVTGAS